MISMGLLNPGDKPLVWRGPMLHSVMQQFLRSVRWGELDYLIVDLPPGTGDVQLALIQSVAVTGAVIVTTPSLVALADVRKAVEMFRQVNVEILGIVENISYFVMPALLRAHRSVWTRRREHMAEAFRITFLGELKSIRRFASAGTRASRSHRSAKTLRAGRAFLQWPGI